MCCCIFISAPDLWTFLIPSVERLNESITGCTESDDIIILGTCNNKDLLQCNECDTQFETKSEYEKHTCTKVYEEENPAPRSCSENRVLGQDRHSSIVNRSQKNQCNDQSKYKCQRCGKNFSYKYNLTRHVYRQACPELKQARKRMLIGENSGTFNCGECAMEFKSRGQYEVHVIEEHSMNQSNCYNCEQSFSQKSNLIRHLKSYQGSSCSKYSSPKYLQVTLKTNEQRALQVSGKDFPKSTVECAVCGIKFSNRRYLELHEIYKHGEGRDLKCMTCENTFTKTHELVRHISAAQCKRKKKWSQIYHDTFVNNKGALCTECGRHFPRRSNYVTHMMRHQMKKLAPSKANVKKKERKLYLCDICNKNVTHLASHKFVHQTEKKFVCECGKKYKEEKSLRSHKVHNCGQVHHCSLCTQIFKDKQYLKMHIFRYHDVDYETLENAGKWG